MTMPKLFPSTLSIRSKLILSVACVHLMLMSIFVIDTFWRQKNFLMREKYNYSIYFAELISENILSWVLADDLMGMDEVLQASTSIIHTAYICVIDPHGKVLAHTQKEKVGTFLNDKESIELFTTKNKRTAQIWREDSAFIHAASPVNIQGNHLGWVLVALSCAELSTHLQELRDNGFTYSCIAAIVGMLAAWLLSCVIFRQLEYIMTGIRGLRKDDSFTPIPVLSNDELGHMASVLNRTLTYLESSRNELKREIMEHALAEKQIRHLSQYLVDANEEERKRLGHDLHDGLGQTVTGLLFTLHFLKTLLKDDPKALQYCEQIIADTIGFGNEIRRVAAGQYPVVLERRGLASEVNALLSKISKGYSQIAVTYRVELPEKRLHPRIELACYRILQESLSNVFKHSGASAVHIELTTLGKHIFMRIADNGKGFDAESKFEHAVECSGIGLLGMKARVIAVKGRMEVDSRPGKGCVIDVILPLIYQNEE